MARSCYKNPGTVSDSGSSYGIGVQKLSETERNSNAMTIMRVLIAGSSDLGGGMTVEIAAGFCGNFHEESNYNPTALGDHKHSFGLAQWRDGRRTNLENFATQIGTSVADVVTQAKFVLYELNNGEKSAWQKIKNATTVDDATELVMKYYERPSNYTTLTSRKNAAREIYNLHEG